ncbi:MAG TPA: flavodoxin family protein [Methanomassiliicoccales archaeon]|nr:flavodoxin family protein [Methanomassiliicoccales archaeon]HQQ24894.1 flavodoxin family protein [Methanomassiliicoccales archaeon]
MRILVIYDTVSGNTERIAQLIAEELVASGNEVSCRRQSVSGEEDFMGVPLWVIGSPTHWGRAPFRFNTLLRNALKDAGNDHAFVAFDTRYEKVHSGAADRIHQLMVKEGLRPLMAPQFFMVEGNQLRQGEEERARELGRTIASLL